MVDSERTNHQNRHNAVWISIRTPKKEVGSRRMWTLRLHAFRVAALAALSVLLLASPASANVTVDLIWADTDTQTLTVGVGDPGNLACDGFFPRNPGRCMKIVWTVGEDGVFAGAHLVRWEPDVDLPAIHAAFTVGIPVGKSATFRKTQKPSGGSSEAGMFEGLSIPENFPPVSWLPPGTYTIGTIIFDLQSTDDGTYAPAPADQYAVFLDSTTTPSPYTMNPATLHIVSGVPVMAPAVAGLAGVALAGLGLWRRRSR